MPINKDFSNQHKHLRCIYSGEYPQEVYSIGWSAKFLYPSEGYTAETATSIYGMRAAQLVSVRDALTKDRA